MSNWLFSCDFKKRGYLFLLKGKDNTCIFKLLILLGFFGRREPNSFVVFAEDGVLCFNALPQIAVTSLAIVKSECGAGKCGNLTRR